MTRRLWLNLQGEPAFSVRRSQTGRDNEIVRAAWSGHYADRALLLFTVVWLALRVDNWTRIRLRPLEVYEPRMWLGELVFPTLPDPTIWAILFVVATATTLFCLLRPRSVPARVLLALSLLLLLTPELGFGHVEHVNHLFLLGHVYSVFRPLGRPESIDEAAWQSKGYTWFLLGLLAVYTASGLWKIVDMTIRDVLKPGVTWMDPEGMLSTSIASMRGHDLSMAIPQVVEALAWAFPIGYVVLTVIFSVSFVAAFRRPMLFIVLPTIVAFHILNIIAIYVLFSSTIFVAILLLTPYDMVFPGIKNRLVTDSYTTFRALGADARYERHYGNGDVDLFLGFYAYRERLRDRSAAFASPLYFPGIAWAASRVLRRCSRSVEENV